jgi:hypothetical protein
MTLPPEGGMDDFIAMARMALKSIPGWPDQRSRALHARVGAGVAGVRPAAIPAPPPAPPVAPAQRLPPRLQRPRSDDWMQDFIESHASSGTSRKPRLTSAATLAPPQAKVDWRGDFETRDSPAPTPKKRREADPDWMKDFQGPDGKGPSSRGR